MPGAMLESASRLVGRIYEAAYRRATLEPVVQDLARLFHGSRACLLRMGVDEESFQAIASADDVGDFMRLGVDALRSDRLLRAMRTLPVGRVVARDRLIDEPTFRRGEVWRRFFQPREMDLGWTCKLRMSGGTSWFVDLQRSEKQGPLSDEELRLFQELIPHFERARGISERIDDAAGIADMLSQLRLGMALVDRKCHGLRMNAAFDELAQSSGGLIRTTGGEIACADRKDTRRLRQFVADCCASGVLPGGGGSMLVTSGDMERRPPLVLSVSPYLGAPPFELGSARRAVILVHEASPSHVVDLAAQLRALFGLTAAEARIAVSLASGSTLKEAAEKSAIRINTARWYLDEIFRKTGTNRQGQLVALLVNLHPLWGRRNPAA